MPEESHQQSEEESEAVPDCRRLLRRMGDCPLRQEPRCRCNHGHVRGLLHLSLGSISFRKVSGRKCIINHSGRRSRRSDFREGSKAFPLEDKQRRDRCRQQGTGCDCRPGADQGVHPFSAGSSAGPGTAQTAGLKDFGSLQAYDLHRQPGHRQDDHCPPDQPLHESHRRAEPGPAGRSDTQGSGCSVCRPDGSADDVSYPQCLRRRALHR